MLYRLSKSRRILQESYEWYKKKGHTLSPTDFQMYEKDLHELDQAILAKNKSQADALARRIEVFNKAHFKKTAVEYVWELSVAIILALIIATIVRLMWFEPYEIPTGSMRPTFKEKDHLTVSKLT